MNLEGKLLGNRYQILEKIGNGGMATVYKAKCLVLNRYVAVKVLRDEFTTDEEFVKRFNIEAQAVASLTHPNIVSVYDVGHEDNLYYIVMELVKGKTLKEIIVEDGTLGWKWSVKVAMQIAAALETAHRNNIVHRDIKPHNIIITEDGIAKVTDFGIAKAVSNSTITAFGTTIGSVHYFSPEHARGGYTDAKSDLYSLGVVMYEMITGKVPFDSDTPVSVALKHMQEEAVPPITLKPELPQSINDIIMKAMQKEPSNRYQTATEMIKDLEEALKNPTGRFVYINTSNEENSKTQRISTQEINKEAKKNKKESKFSKLTKYFEEHKFMKVLAIILLFILVFAGAFGGTALIGKLTKVKEVQIPDFSNMTLEEAKNKAKEANLELVVKEEKFHLEIEEGKIIEQSPKYQENYKVKEGSTVEVIVSKGQEIVVMPKAVGEKKDDAVKLLKEAGLEVETKEENSDTVEKGIIIKQTTEDGKEVEKDEEIPAGTKIILYVSMGIEQVEVPDLSGKTESEAKETIETAKLKWKSTNKISDSSKPNGVVVNQSVSPKSYVDKDTEITITVNEFDEIKTGTINVNVKSLTGYTTLYDEEGKEVTPDNVRLRIEVDGEQVEDKSVSKASTNESVRVDGKGTVTVKVYIDGNKKAEKNFNINNGSITID